MFIAEHGSKNVPNGTRSAGSKKKPTAVGTVGPLDGLATRLRRLGSGLVDHTAAAMQIAEKKVSLANRFSTLWR